MTGAPDPNAEIRASFFLECEELSEALQDGLQAMQDGSHDDETINVVFRAVHSIKGGAGAFGLEDLVRFSHRFETALDAVRAGQMVPDAGAVALFFRASDTLSDLIRAARDDTGAMDTGEVLAALDALLGDSGIEEEDEVTDFQPMGLALDLPGAEAGLPPLPDLPLPDLPQPDLPQSGDLAAGDPAARGFTIRFAPRAELYATGNEPRRLLALLAGLGRLELICETDTLPPLSALDPLGAYLSWHIRIETEESEAELRELFDFVSDLCTLDFTPLGAPALPDLPPLPLAPEATLPPPPAVTAPDAAAPVDAQTPPPVAPPVAKPAAKPAATPRQTVRVELDRIDRLVNLVGELVINQAMLTQSVAEAGLSSTSDVADGLNEFLQLTRDIQDSVMLIRAQPVKSLFQRMGRIVREASGAVGKSVQLITEGERTEIDKTVIERLADPLTHMIRNAVDHGLETPEARRAAGKPEAGQIHLSAGHRSGRVVIEITDDGAGIDRARVLQKARDKGLVPADAALSEAEIDTLLFLPGFSTAAQVSDLSGRGVGMDVVRTEIQALGGRIAIRSTPGEGTTFSVSLPLTLAVMDGMVIRAAGETLVIPLGAISETLTLAAGDIRSLGAQTSVVALRDQFLPLLDLGAELGYRPPQADYDGAIVLVIRLEDGCDAALVVDAIVDQRQVVIKGLPDRFGRVPGVAAATILGDGKIALILDPADVIATANGQTRTAPPPLQRAG